MVFKSVLFESVYVKNMAHPACGKKLTDRINFGIALEGVPDNLAPFVHDSTRK